MDTKNTNSEISECPICLVALDKNDKSIITVNCCNQQFHVSCYINCMLYNNACPLCRTIFNTSMEPSENTQHIQQQQHIHRLNPINPLHSLPDTIVNINVLDEDNNTNIVYRRQRIRFFGYIISLGTCVFTVYMFSIFIKGY